MEVRKTKRKLSISQKIIRRALLAYIAVLVISLVLAEALIIPRLRNDAEINSLESLKRIQDQYNLIVEDASDYLSGLSSLQTFREYLRNCIPEGTEAARARLTLYLGAFQQSNTRVFFTMIENEDGNMISSNLFMKDKYLRYVRENPHHEKLFSMRTSYVSPIYYPDVDFAKDGTVDSTVLSSLNPFFFFSERLYIAGQDCVLTLFYKAAPFIRLIDAAANTGIGEYLLIDKYGEIIYSQMSEEHVAIAKELASNVFAPQIYRKEHSIYYTQPLHATGGYIVGCRNSWDLLKQVSPLIFSALGMLIIPPLIIYISIAPITRHSLSEVQNLSDKMKDFKLGDAPPEIVETGDEAEHISRILNNLVTSINSQSEELVRKEQENAETRYKLLTTQLDPHFVSNTMNIVNIMARHGKTEDIQIINNALIRILRNRLNTSQAVFGTVKDEVELLRQYMLIVGYRYATNVNVSYDVSEDAGERLILKNMLHLLVENSLFHGLLKEDDSISGSITVNVYTNGAKIGIEESDDGTGIEPERLALLRENDFLLEEKNRNAHIGLRNIYERLGYIYGNDFTMEIFSEPGEGTTVVITAPIFQYSIGTEGRQNSPLS